MKKKILVVDDSESIRELVEFTLTNAGYDVMVSHDGDHAMTLFDGRTINLVITDLNMPGKDGIQLIRDIRSRQDYNGLPILLLTTESQAAKKDEAKNAGATGWVVKPFVQDKLLAVIQKIIR